jgi:transcriptional regulator with XRE-family HTH domain
MTPIELREARRKLGLSTAALAKVLRLGSNGGRTVRRWEAGEFEPSGPVIVAIELMLEKPSAVAWLRREADKYQMWAKVAEAQGKAEYKASYEHARDALRAAADAFERGEHMEPGP